MIATLTRKYIVKGKCKREDEDKTKAKRLKVLNF